MRLFSWIKSLGSSSHEQTKIIELSDEQKDLIEMDKELERLKNRKFRVERVEYKKNNSVFYYAQMYGKVKYEPYRSTYIKEYYDNEWWGLCTGQGGNVFVDHFMGGGTARMDEQGALQLIEDYKKKEEEEIRSTPERKKYLRYYEKMQAERKKEIEAENEKNKPIRTHKNIE